MSKKARAEVRFQGKVQGVFFRINTRKFAIGNGVAGEVKNCPDGSVKAVFEGERKNIEMTIHQCLHRQPHAKVSNHDVYWSKYSGKYEDFKVRYGGGC
ncbi:MAG: acylphosphatase [Candidatus Thermoplasmatota archaeon]|jgi:acylphosphatase|nr:acylphosphatase [Candidatus Thermoplasmatota archaeon]MDP7266284.1 acylphosphatase [Candidatus Thermoplasmatota archaeon]